MTKIPFIKLKIKTEKIILKKYKITKSYTKNGLFFVLIHLFVCFLFIYLLIYYFQLLFLFFFIKKTFSFIFFNLFFKNLFIFLVLDIYFSWIYKNIFVWLKKINGHFCIFVGLSGVLTCFGSLRENIDTIGSLEGHWELSGNLKRMCYFFFLIKKKRKKCKISSCHLPDLQLIIRGIKINSWVCQKHKSLSQVKFR